MIVHGKVEARLRHQAPPRPKNDQVLLRREREKKKRAIKCSSCLQICRRFAHEKIADVVVVNLDDRHRQHVAALSRTLANEAEDLGESLRRDITSLTAHGITPVMSGVPDADT